MSFVYHTSNLVAKISFWLLTRCQVRGRENIPVQGPLLVVANHLSSVDPPLVGVILRRKAIFMAKKELFHPALMGYFFSSVGAFPVHRGRLDREALRHAEGVLAEGKTLVMFPEGMRSPNGRLLTAFPGSAMVALHNGVSILPIGISGTGELKGFTWCLRRPRITVNIGTPFHLPPVKGKISKEQLTERTNFIMGHIAELLPIEYRGDYGNREK
ncbi:MAG: lysophospholipid acyltransferase family protein [Dehalococcoidales bacterium]|nr:lysophospholipid acyltransferase family protein [Dehalococcoidales bacterium]